MAGKWKTLDPEQRIQLRKQVFERVKQRRLNMRDKGPRRSDDGVNRREELRRKNEEKMQKRRDAIRRLRPGQGP
mgnify:FL=1